jgi:hypothetical protein
VTLYRAWSGSIATTRGAHPPSSLRGDVCSSELPATPSVPISRKATRGSESTDQTGRDAEGAGHLRRAENRRSLTGSRRGLAILVCGKEKPTLRWCVRVSLLVKVCSGTGTGLVLKPPVRADVDERANSSQDIVALVRRHPRTRKQPLEPARVASQETTHEPCD